MIVSEADLVNDLIFNDDEIKKYIVKNTTKSLKYLKKVTKHQFNVLKKYAIRHIELATIKGYPILKFYNLYECDDIGGYLFDIAQIVSKTQKPFHDFIVTSKGVLFTNVYPIFYNGKIIALSEIGVRYRDFLMNIFKKYFIGFVIDKKIIDSENFKTCKLNKNYYIDGNICRVFKNFNKKVDFAKKINIENGYVIFSYPVYSLGKHIGYFVKVISLKEIPELNDLKKETKKTFIMLIVAYIILILFLLGLNKYLKTEKIAMTDKLTEVLNRTGCEKYIKKLKNYTLMIIDIDYFKRINDTFGHDVGDEILSKLGEIIKNNLRKNDIVCRWGGEEFVVILPNENLKNSVLIAEKIKNAIKEYEFSNNIHISVSIGISIFEKNFSKTFKKADEKLYEAKNSGRDRISF